MKTSIREAVEKILPTFIAQKVVFFGKVIKKSFRVGKRFFYGMGRPFVRKAGVDGVSFRIVLDPYKNAGVDENIARDGFWENDLGRQLIKNIKNGDVFLDIGANIGYHSLFAAAVLGETGRVHSFEPLPELCDQLARSVKENGFTNIEIHNFGLSDKDDDCEIHIRDENTGGSSLLSFPGIDTVKISNSKRIKIKKLDDLFPEDFKVDAIKIDTEGYEFEVLRGAFEVLSRNHPIIFMEFSPVFYRQDYQEKPFEFVAFLRGLGYGFSTLDGQQLNLENWLNEGGNIDTQLDIICRAQQTRR